MDQVMKMLFIAAVTALSLMIPVSGYAAFTCSDLHGFWKTYSRLDQGNAAKDPFEDGVNWGLYMGYVVGVSESLRIMKKWPINWPEEQLNNLSSSAQHLHIVGKWLENNPVEWHQTAFHCVVLAFAHAFGINDTNDKNE